MIATLCPLSAASLTRVAPRVTRWPRASVGRGRDWRVRFKENERDDLERLLGQVKEKRHEARQNIKEGKPTNLQDIMSAIMDLHADLHMASHPGHVRSNVVAGRVAMVGFVMACACETFIPSHPGILTQVSLGTGLSTPTVAQGFLILVTWYITGAVISWSTTWPVLNLKDVGDERPQGRPVVWNNPLKHPLKFVGLSTDKAPYKWGFNRNNELFHGRLAMLGFFGSLVNEVRMGGAGPVAQVAHLVGTPADDYFYVMAVNMFVLFCLIAIALSFTTGSSNIQKREDDLW